MRDRHVHLNPSPSGPELTVLYFHHLVVLVFSYEFIMSHTCSKCLFGNFQICYCLTLSDGKIYLGCSHRGLILLVWTHAVFYSAVHSHLTIFVFFLSFFMHSNHKIFRTSVVFSYLYGSIRVLKKVYNKKVER